MCGICVFIYSNNDDSLHKEKVKESICCSRLSRRGPDIQTTLEQVLIPNIWGVFYGCTLHFRGELTRQPLQDGQGDVLLWNGEIFGGLQVGSEQNDGAMLLSELGQCESDDTILELLSLIRGPWALVYWKASTKQLWFGRDIFGRRSLLYHNNIDGTFGLASIAIKQWTPWCEVPAVGVFCAMIQCTPTLTLQFDHVTLYPWSESLSGDVGVQQGMDIYNKTLMSQGPPLGDVHVIVSQTMISPGIKPFNSAECEIELCMEVGESQNIDSLANDHQRALAYQLTKVLQNAVKVRTECQSDMCSTCIENHLKLFLERTKTPRTDPVLTECDSAINDHTLVHDDSLQPLICLPPVTEGCGHARVAVLFSGGIDSLVIAALADRCVAANEPIDLLNVAFEQKKTIKIQSKKGKHCIPVDPEHYTSSYEVPDRVTGKEGLEQLKSLNPQRHWNFVQIDVPLEELQKARTDHVADLVYPLNTVLDDSIGCAIWFAARGCGVIINQSGEGRHYYTSPARVVLVGMGADEQLVGYSRHRVKFNTSGWSGLCEEIKMEVERISSRNLGRDDRVISDSSRESRFPFLDEDVVSFLNQLPLHDKANLHLPRGIGEKFLLRLAAEHLGLTRGAMAPKRAIQFGSRIAKAENRKEKGSDSCGRLQEGSSVASGHGV